MKKDKCFSTQTNEANSFLNVCLEGNTRLRVRHNSGDYYHNPSTETFGGFELDISNPKNKEIAREALLFALQLLDTQ